MSTSPRELKAQVAPARSPHSRSLPSALTALLAACAALGLALSATGLITAGQILVAGPGGPLWP
jgi:hypothetical protein